MPEDESQTPPVIPSFASLRAPRRRAAMDWLDPEPPPEVAVAAVEAPPPPRAPRPPEWPDLLRLGVHLARSLACVPGRLALWSLQRLAGDGPVTTSRDARPGGR